MKNIITKFIAVALVLLVTSCDDEKFLGDNVDPNNPVAVTPDLVLAPVFRRMAFSQERNRGQNTLGNLFMYNWSQSDGFSWYSDEFLYGVTSSFYDQNWDYPYVNQLKQLKVLENLEGDENGYYVAISKILKSYQYQILVDTYGDIPYSEASQRGVNPFPKYDDAEEIYDNLVVDLNSAIGLINTTAGNTSITPLVPGNDDGLFRGDMDSWKQFANSVKVRILARLLNDSSRHGYIQGEFAKINADGVLLADALVQAGDGYANQENQQNPKWAAFGFDVAGNITNNNDATCATPFVLNHLTNTLDNRIDFIYEKPGTGHLGVIQGELNYDVPVVDQFDPTLVSNIGPGILKSASQDAVFMTLAETHLNIAEIALMIPAVGQDPEQHYKDGIQASFDYLGAPNASTYYNRNINNVNYAFSTNKQEAIITQKWIAVNGIDAIQSWFDYSRTGFPSNLPISALASSADRPVRLAYPSSELTTNSSNVPAQPNAFTAKIFWAN